MLNRYLVQMRNAAQRWFKFKNQGTSPCKRSGHAMASDGTRVFVLGGYSEGVRVDQISLIHVFNTSMYVRFLNLSGQPSKSRTQMTSTTRIRIPSVARRLPNLRGNHPQFSQPRSNHWHSSRNLLYRRRTMLPVCKSLYRAPLSRWR